MIKSPFLCPVVIHFALIVRKNYPSMASSNARTTRVHIRSVLTNCQLTIKYWLDCRWRRRPTRRSAPAKWPKARFSTVQHIPPKRSSSTACKTVRCSVLSVSWNMLSKSTKSLIAHPKVRTIWNTISSLRTLSNFSDPIIVFSAWYATHGPRNDQRGGGVRKWDAGQRRIIL